MSKHNVHVCVGQLIRCSACISCLCSMHLSPALLPGLQCPLVHLAALQCRRRLSSSSSGSGSGHHTAPSRTLRRAPLMPPASRRRSTPPRRRRRTRCRSGCRRTARLNNPCISKRRKWTASQSMSPWPAGPSRRARRCCASQTSSWSRSTACLRTRPSRSCSPQTSCPSSRA